MPDHRPDYVYTQDDVDFIVHQRLAEASEQQFADKIVGELKEVGRRLDESNHWKAEFCEDVRIIKEDAGTSREMQAEISRALVSIQRSQEDLQLSVRPLTEGLSKAGLDAAGLFPVILENARRQAETAQANKERHTITLNKWIAIGTLVMAGAAILGVLQALGLIR